MLQISRTQLPLVYPTSFCPSWRRPMVIGGMRSALAAVKTYNHGRDEAFAFHQASPSGRSRGARVVLKGPNFPYTQLEQAVGAMVLAVIINFDCGDDEYVYPWSGISL